MRKPLIILFTQLPAFLLVLSCVFARGQAAPIVIAWQAPPCTGSNSYCSPYSMGSNFYNFTMHELPSISGIGITVHWASIDTGCKDSSGNDYGCSTVPTQCPELYQYTDYKFCNLDKQALAYINHSLTSFANKKIVFIIWPTSEPNVNSVTPQYIFTQEWANQNGARSCSPNCAPQDVAVCPSYTGDLNNTSCPVALTGASYKTGDFGIWNVNGGLNGGGGCSVLGSDLSCPGSCSLTGFQGFPVVYEQPFLIGYENFLAAFAQHYNPVTGNLNGQTIAPYIAYVRAGMSEGGENQLFCATSGFLAPPQTRTAGQTVPAGYLTNWAGSLYVATSGGKAANTSVLPTCSSPGCTTAPDGTIAGWYNAGPFSGGSTANAVWPGPNGLAAQAFSITDNGYLTTWTGGAPGYITAMLTFLKGLGASFPFDISAHNGPPSDQNVAYSDSEASIASANGVGFGMESVSVGDSLSYAAGQYSNLPPYATSSSDWVHNFKIYSAPVHHLQAFFPGANGIFAAGYAINNFSVDVPNKILKISCTVADCSPLATGGPVYISGNTNSALNNIWLGTCPPSTNIPPPTCLSSTNLLEIQMVSIPSGLTTNGSGGVVWAPDYWPIIMPLAVQSGATSIEVYECDLDYAFGAYYYGYPTTTWFPPGTSGCLIPNSGPPISPISGPDIGYQNSIANTLVNQPSGTSSKAGQITSTKSVQF